MIGKLFGAMLGKKIAGENSGASGAILGYGAAALARRSVPAARGRHVRRLGTQALAREAPRGPVLSFRGDALFAQVLRWDPGSRARPAP